MVPRGNSCRTSTAARGGLRAVLMLGTALGMAGFVMPALAQVPAADLGARVDVPEGTRLFLEADTVTYDSERSTVTASGGVQVNYGPYRLVARNLVYNQETGRLVAAGDVELIEPSGNRIYADAVDVTDDFADGFVEALRVETPDNTRFAASRGARRDGEVTTFEQGVYTACEACAENPERAPLWQVKAQRIVWDQPNQVIRYYGARFELFGAPLLYLPYFASPDGSATRQSGFLAPELRGSSETGTGLRVPYYYVISDDKDVTVAGTYYANQGFMAEAEYRQAFESGYITLKAAGISQNDPDGFNDFYADGVTPRVEELYEERGMVGTQAQFAINERWTVGWDALLQSDHNFSNAYSIEGFDETYRTNEVYLTGLGTRSYFDLRAQWFNAQTNNSFDQETQPVAVPTFDYETISDTPLFGGEVELDVNVINLWRDATMPSSLLLCRQEFINNGICIPTAGEASYRDDAFRHTTLKGNHTRATTQAEWRRSIYTETGLVLTPTVFGRADLFHSDMETPGYNFAASGNNFGAADIDETGVQGMVAAAFEARYPYLIETQNTSHVIEPIAQVIVRPNEMNAGILPNEDAQSLVFSTSNLFSLDKFSGYDRTEGGTRANVGVQYAGVLGSGYLLDATVGQSFHLAGDNPFAQPDLALLGYESGLETDRSDYVASLALTTPVGLTLAVQTRFDEGDLALQRADLTAGFNMEGFSAALTYSDIAAQPTYGFAEDRQQVSVSAGLQLTQTLNTFGSLSYDIQNESVISRSFGVGYADECFSLIAEYRSTSDRYLDEPAKTEVFFRLSLRTLVETEYSYNIGDSDS